MPGPHDTFFKEVFARPEEALGTLKAVLPPALFEQLDLASAELVDDSLIDDHLRSRHVDRLYRLRVAGRETLLYVLWEAQATVDPLMPVRLLI